MRTAVPCPLRRPPARRRARSPLQPGGVQVRTIVLSVCKVAEAAVQELSLIHI